MGISVETGGGVVGHELAQQRCDAGGRGRRRDCVEPIGSERTAPAVGVLRLVERQEPGEHGAGALVDQVDVGEIPTGVAHRDAGQQPIAGRDLEALPGDRDRAVALALHAPLLGGEGEPERLAGGACTADVGALGEAVERGLASLGVDGAVVLHLDPRLGGVVQDRQGEIGDALEHRHQAALDLGPEHFLLGVLVGRMRQGRSMHDAEAHQSLRHLGGDHGRAVVGHQGARQATLLERLAESVHQVLCGLLPQVPLDVAGEPRAVVEDAEQERRDPHAGGGQHFLRAVVEVEVPEAVNVVGLEAAHLALREPGRGPAAAGRVGEAAALHQSAGVHEAPERSVGGQRSQAGVATDQGSEVAVVQRDAPTRMIGVLQEQPLLELLTHGVLLAGVLAHLAAQRPDGIESGAARLVVPALDGRAAELDRFPADRMQPRLGRQGGEGRLELAGGRRRGQKRAHHREPQVRPAFMDRGLGGLVHRLGAPFVRDHVRDRSAP